ncbi:MAG: beta-lactamase family protein, partial [Roseiflexaceae bacterium]|nr:beta-lactamase family protein [Roseiflexaceae bacterium]
MLFVAKEDSLHREKGTRRKLLVLALALLLTAAAPQHSAFAARADNAEIDRYVAQQVRDARLPGLSFAIVRDGALVHSGSYGSAADGQPLTAQTPFGIGSMTKSFTALAAMQLAEAGEIELDAPVQRYLPWFRVADPAASAQITVRHLLNQTSGLSQHDGFWDAAASGDPLEQRVRALADVRLGSAPGSEFAYSNSNFDVLGMVIQQVSGQQYAAYVAEHILQPLEMANSSFAPAVRAPGHQDWYGLALPARPGVGQAMLPAGGLYSSAEDMGRYLIDQLAAGRAGNGLLSPAGYAELHRASGVGGSRYAMGWVARTNQNPPMVEHGGASPAYHSQMLFAPQQGLGVVVLSNINTVPFGSIPAERIAEGTLALLVGGTPQAAGFAGASTPLLFKWGL